MGKTEEISSEYFIAFMAQWNENWKTDQEKVHEQDL